MGAICQTVDPNIKKILDLKTKFSNFNKDPEADNRHNRNRRKEHARKDFLTILKGLEIKLWDHYKIFYKYKNEIEKTNPELFKSLFSKENNNKKEIQVSNVEADDEPKFLFFFNKRDYLSVTMTNCHLIFPRFNMQYFPKFENAPSKLTRITINDSTVVFEKENPEHYSKLPNLEYLDLSYNNLENLNENIKRLSQLKTLLLKRNSLTSLPSTIGEMENLTEIDLTDNKLTKLPNLRFEKLVTLNLNMNQLENFDYQLNLTNPPLEYLLIANNHLKSFPLDIKRFTNLKHVALDGNKISEIPHSIFVEIKFDLKISIMNNPIKNKEMFSKNIINDIFEIDSKKTEKAEKERQEQEKVEKKKNEMNAFTKKLATHKILPNLESKGVFSKNIPDMLTSQPTPFTLLKIASNSANLNSETEGSKKDFDKKEDMMEVERLIQTEKINSPQHIIEHIISKKIEDVINSLRNKKMILDQFKSEIKREKLKIICDEFKKILNNRQEREIAKFGDYDLKYQMKLCYGVYNKYKESLITGNKPEITEEESELYSYISGEKHQDQVSITKLSKLQKKGANDLSNLIFLKELKHSLTSSKLKLFLQYLSNLDFKLKALFERMIDDNEKSTLILLCTEIKLFLKELIEYYDYHTTDFQDIKYEIKIGNKTNVIHKIFNDNTTVKILYRLGLKGFKTKYEQNIGEFIISHQLTEKYKLLENFLLRFIKIIQTYEIDILALE